MGSFIYLVCEVGELIRKKMLSNSLCGETLRAWPPPFVGGASPNLLPFGSKTWIGKGDFIVLSSPFLDGRDDGDRRGLLTTWSSEFQVPSAFLVLSEDEEIDHVAAVRRGCDRFDASFGLARLMDGVFVDSGRCFEAWMPVSKSQQSYLGVIKVGFDRSGDVAGGTLAAVIALNSWSDVDCVVEAGLGFPVTADVSLGCTTRVWWMWAFGASWVWATDLTWPFVIKVWLSWIFMAQVMALIVSFF